MERFAVLNDGAVAASAQVQGPLSPSVPPVKRGRTLGWRFIAMMDAGRRYECSWTGGRAGLAVDLGFQVLLDFSRQRTRGAHRLAELLL